MNSKDAYLKLMGIDVYIPKHQLPESEAVLETVANTTINAEQSSQPVTSHQQGASAVKPEQVTSVEAPIAEELTITEAETAQQVMTNVSNDSSGLVGLRWLSKPTTSGVLVVLPVAQSQLNPDARQLLIKMIQAIGVKAAECAYLSADSSSLDEQINITDIKGVMVFGKSAGDHLVHHCGARRIPGESFFELLQSPMVVTLHPDELLDTPVLKRQAWSDLQSLDRLMQQQTTA